MKNWRTTINGFISIAIGIGMAYVTIMIIPWGQFPPEFPSELKTGLMSVLMLGAGGLVTNGVGLINSRDNAESEKVVKEIKHEIEQKNQQRQVAHYANERRIEGVEEKLAAVPEVAAKVAEKTAEEVAAEVARKEK